jgi:hypothetical protein
MNTYTKYAPNVFLAKTEEEHKKGEKIIMTSKYGRESTHIVYNLVGKKEGYYYYSIVRDEETSYAEKKADKLLDSADNAEKKSYKYWEDSQEGRDFLRLAEPIKTGHHSEKRHRALIERNHKRMGKSVEYTKKAEELKEKASYWQDKAKEINLSMPQSVEYFKNKLEKAKKIQTIIKNMKPKERPHSYSLQYANKEVKELTEKYNKSLILWGE